MAEEPGVQMARRAVAAAHPRVLAAAKALCRAETIPWDQIGPQQQYTFCADAAAALNAANQVGAAAELWNDECPCGHSWEGHSLETGCGNNWQFNGPDPGIASADGCMCQLAHTEKSTSA